MPARKQLKAGEKFGRWTVVSDGEYAGGAQTAMCRCECGTARRVSAANIRQRPSPSCGCARQDTLAALFRGPVKIGERFGRLVVTGEPLYENRMRNPHGGFESPKVPCMCDCGSSCCPPQACLRRGTTQSCGCLHRERSSEAANRDIKRRANLDRMYVGPRGRIPMRSSWEIAVAHRLDRDQLEWQYEPQTFRLGGDMRYTPDFRVNLGAMGFLWIEVKGEFFGRAAEKVSRFRATGNALYLVGKDNFEEYAGVSPYLARKMYPRCAA